MSTSGSSHAAEEAQDALRERLADTQAWVSGADRRLRELVSERPLLVLGGTVLAGYLLGRLLARR